MKFIICISQLITKILLKHQSLDNIRHCLTEHNHIWRFFYQKTLKYFNDLQNQNFSVLWLKWTQTMEMKKNQIFFHGTYSNLAPHLFLSKNIKLFQWLSKSKFLSIMTKVNPNNGNETKSDIFSMGHIQIWHNIFFIKKYWSILISFKIKNSQFFN